MSDLDKDELKATRELNKNKYKNADIFGVNEDKNKKVIDNFKKYIDNLEKQQNFLYNMEDYYKDDIEQNELLLKMLNSVLNYIKQLETDKQNLIDKLEEDIVNISKKNK